ncbi:MAG: class I SAM-dependent methyltransferase [bacterium]
MSRQGSRTALGVAMARAAHMLLDGEPKILNDPTVLQLLGPSTVEQIRAVGGKAQSGAARGLRAHVVLRSRFAEDRLAEAVKRGVTQYVILGAGGDTFAYRQPDWAKSIRVFEIDHVASQEDKRQRLTAAGINIPSNVRYAPIDFETTTLRDGLVAGGVDLAAPTFFSWLGVTMYLTATAIDAVLKTVAAFGQGSEIVFTYARRERAERNPADGPSLADIAASMGEPWLSYFDVDELDGKLRSYGFTDVYFLTAADAGVRYFADRTDALQSPLHPSVVSAAV